MVWKVESAIAWQCRSASRPSSRLAATAALVQGGLSLRESPFPAILSDPQYLRLRSGITLGVDPGLQQDQPDGRGAKVTITTRTGSTVSQRVDWPRGHSRRGGVNWADLSEKWHDGLPQYDVDKILALAQGLDELGDVNELAEAFTPAQP